MLLMYVLFLSTASAFISHHPIHRIRTNHLHISATTTSQDVWWKEGVNFKCTGCGKCCMNDGEVWLDVDEFHDLCSSLNMTYESALDQYVESIQSNWVKLKSKGSDITPGVTSQCIFLADDGKQCSIYSSRPAQCRSYPYWPRLLSSPSEFNDEGVLPDGMGGPSAKHWSPRDGGCEGINHENATLVSAKNIYRNLELYKSYTELFPFMANGDDKNRLLGALDVVHAVTKSTRAWVNEFVVKYDLCPFARSVFESDRVRYRVFLGSDMTRLQQRVRYEMLHLLTVPEDEVATTLLIAPFAFPEFSAFYDFMLDFEDIQLPAILKELKGPEDGGNAPSPSKSRLLKRAAEKTQEQNKEIQLASFHPSFQWADSEFDDELNFEKRSPFPVINLLRAARVREYANEESTKRISGYNSEVLESAGSEALRNEMEEIIRLALS